MAGFKQHCSFTFFKYSLMDDPHGIFSTVGKTAMGQLGQIKDLKDLPKDKILKDYIKQAMKLNEAGAKLPSRSKGEGVVKLDTPEYFIKALKSNKAADLAYKAFTPGKKNEYIEWLEGAKTEATKTKRIAEAIKWIGEGKSRFWKYAK
ncbi:MAG: hypothetical protein EOO89_32135 [Pedobacter sp.]|nr:MAG: hypothetical protein EOO89_32135 [Pedobacter sp.]